ncbi:MAG: hypothetical protein Q4A61_03090 [Porphyromonadaceae bacterium]|nr:hypothetical protein [Porphyromonadaceae bacterium]
MTKNADNTYTIYHSVGHSRYIPLLTTEDSRDVANYFEVRDTSFKVRLTYPNENRSAYPNGFSYAILGDNNTI